MKKEPVPVCKPEDVRISMQNEKFAEWIDLVGVHGAEIHLVQWRKALMPIENGAYTLMHGFGTAEECEEFARFLDQYIKTNGIATDTGGAALA